MAGKKFYSIAALEEQEIVRIEKNRECFSCGSFYHADYCMHADTLMKDKIVASLSCLDSLNIVNLLFMSSFERDVVPAMQTLLQMNGWPQDVNYRNLFIFLKRCVDIEFLNNTTDDVLKTEKLSLFAALKKKEKKIPLSVVVELLSAKPANAATFDLDTLVHYLLVDEQKDVFTTCTYLKMLPVKKIIESSSDILLSELIASIIYSSNNPAAAFSVIFYHWPTRQKDHLKYVYWFLMCAKSEYDFNQLLINDEQNSLVLEAIAQRGSKILYDHMLAINFCWLLKRCVYGGPIKFDFESIIQSSEDIYSNREVIATFMRASGYPEDQISLFK